MRSTAGDIVQDFYFNYARQDIGAAVDLCQPDVDFSVHVPSELVAFGGRSRDRASLAHRLRLIHDIFDVGPFEPYVLSAGLDTVRAHVRFKFRHRATGQYITATMRHDWQIIDGAIQRCDVYHDAPRLIAFFRLLDPNATTGRQDGRRSEPTPARIVCPFAVTEPNISAF